jgi:hypothetical protein
MSETSVNKQGKDPALNIIKNKLQQFIKIKNEIKDFVNKFTNVQKDDLNKFMNRLIENPNNKVDIEIEYAKHLGLTTNEEIKKTQEYLDSAIPLFQTANNLENELLSNMSVFFGIPNNETFLISSLKPLLDKIRISDDITPKDITDSLKGLSKAMVLSQILSKLPMIPVVGPVFNGIINIAQTSSSAGETLGVLKKFLLDAGVDEDQLQPLTTMQEVAEKNPLVQLYNILFKSPLDLEEFINQLKEEVAKHFPFNHICPVPNQSDDITQNGGKIKTLKNKKRSIHRTLNNINNTILNYLKRNSRRFQPFRKSIASRKVKRRF